MNKLFFDIETLPAEDSKKSEYIEILKKKTSNSKLSDEQVYLTTSLDGSFGRILCIGYIKEVGRMVEKGVIQGTEKEILGKFWQLAADVHLFVGHNIWDFDFPFIYKRSIISGIKPRFDISFARYRSYPIFDTMKEWEKWSTNYGPKLDTLAKVLGLPTSKTEIDGSMIWPYYQAGRTDEICQYCLKDVELERSIYQAMTFEEI